MQMFRHSTEEGLIQGVNPPKTVAPPLTDQITIISGLCGVANYSLRLYKWRHQGDFAISTPVSKYSIKSIIL